MTARTLPSDWTISRFEMQIEPNTRRFGSPYAPSSEQVLDLFGDYWVCMLTINAGRALPTGTGALRGGSIQALIDLLAGGQDTLVLHDLRRPRPLGTIGDAAQSVSVVNGSAAAVSVVNGSAAAVTVVGGSPMVVSTIAQYARTATLGSMRPGTTAYAGDPLQFSTGQTVRILVDAVADGNGNMTITFGPCARSVVPAGSAVVTASPTVPFRLKRGARPALGWRAGQYEPVTLDLVEAT